MNRIIIVAPFILVAFIFSASAQEIATTTTPTKTEQSLKQVTVLPVALEGRWYGPDRFIRSHSQVFELESINIKAMTATATYWSTQSRCNKANIPLTLTAWDGKTLEWRLTNPDDAPMCLSTLSGSLTIGQSESIGRLVTGGRTYSAVDLVLK